MATSKGAPSCHPQFMILRTESLCLVSCRRLVLPRVVSCRTGFYARRKPTPNADEVVD